MASTTLFHRTPLAPTMFSIQQEKPPAWSLLTTYRGGDRPEAWDGYRDCFSIEISRPVTLPAFVYAFYTSPVFKVERAIIHALVGRPSTDAQARELAEGLGDRFSAWQVCQRMEQQILLGDYRGRTRSWLAVTPLDGDRDGRSLLRFGSGVAAPAGRGTARRKFGAASGLLTGFHVVYSQVLLHAAKRRLDRAVA